MGIDQNVNRGTLKRLYWEKGMSQYEIAEKLDIPRSTINRKMRKWEIPRRPRSKTVKWKKKPLSYILGVLKGDGSIYVEEKDTYEVRLSQKKRKFAKSFENALGEIGLNPNTWVYAERYTTIAWRKNLVVWYNNLTLDDIRIFIKEKEEYMEEFLRGFYESEGCNGAYGYGWELAIYNSNKKLLKFVQEILKCLNFDFHFSRKTENLFQLRSYSKHQNKRFIEQISPVIKNQIVEPKYKQWSKEKIKESLIELSEKLGHSPTVKETPTDLFGAASRYFGSWNNAKKKAGLEVF